MNKKIIAVILLYLVQFMASSCVIDCGCEDKKTFDKLYDEVRLELWDMNIYPFTPLEDKKNADKLDFGLTMMVTYDVAQIGAVQQKLSFNSLGFTTANACSCASDEYIATDPITSFQIMATDTATEEITDVTHQFITYNYDDEPITINEYREIYYYEPDDVVFRLIDVYYFPNTVQFEVKANLASGRIISQKTPVVTFVHQ
ncbi:hypothetical protein [Cellulophaga sp. HaHa_2_1]|uniref:hypothetical protein n=1 Tax=Cellulophaga sp. HaHa_2_1 TaxID=2749994 RepID=UPI001C4FEC7F|nr:hypothetical protein [Cellulophaga sp. HaHa_2_1]QXP51051.1 hypothetical protein H0I24_12955 [Cellulophaga sp. HaHa_2_1]